MTLNLNKQHTRQIQIISLSLGITLLAGLIYFLFFRPLPAWRAIPPLAYMAWTLPAAEPLGKLAPVLGLESVGLELRAYDSIRRAWSLPVQDRVWLVAERAEKGSLSTLVIFSLPGGRYHFPTQSPPQFSIKGVAVYGQQLGDQTLYWARYRGLVLLSSQAFILEEALENSVGSWYSSYRGPKHQADEGVVWHLNLQQWLLENSPHQIGGHNNWVSFRQSAAQGKASSYWRAAWRGGTDVASDPKLWAYIAGMPESAFTRVPDAEQATNEWKQWVSPWLAYPVLEAVYQDKSLWVLAANDINKAKRLLEQADPQASTYAYLNFALREIRSPAFFTSLGSKQSQGGWWLSLDGVVVCAQDRATLEVWADHYLVGATLDKDPAFVEAVAQTQGNLIAWMQPDALAILLERHLAGWQAPAWFDGYASFSLGLSAKEGHLVLGGIRASGEVAARSWKYELNSPVQAWKPVRSAEQQETRSQVAVQSADGWLHLINPDGQAQWRFQLAGKLLSDVYRLDKLVKGRVYYLFNTDTDVYLLDEQGTKQDRLNLHLSAAATAGLLAIDTSGVGGYAFFLPTTNQRLNAWSINGAPLRGWSPHAQVMACSAPMQYYTFANKAFVVAQDEQGQVWAFNRQGQPQFKAAVPAGLSLAGGWQTGQLSGAAALQQSRLVACSTQGKLYVSNFLGEQFPLAAVTADSSLPVSHWQMANLSGDERYEYLIQRGTQLDVLGYDGKQFGCLQTLTLPAGSDQAGYLWAGADRGYLYALNSRTQQLALAQNETKAEFSRFFPAEYPPLLLVNAHGKTLIATVYKGAVYGFE